MTFSILQHLLYTTDDLMQTEYEYLGLLEKVTGVELKNGTLILKTDTGETLTFVKEK